MDVAGIDFPNQKNCSKKIKTTEKEPDCWIFALVSILSQPKNPFSFNILLSLMKN